jgi:hypothetical protein
LQRFVVLLNYLSEIEESVKKLRNAEFVQYRQHIGAGWFVSVTTGYQCVDIRRFYMPNVGFEEKPSKSGLALRLSEWIDFVAVVRIMKEENPHLAKIQPCGPHHNQQEALNCAECYPFPSVTFGFINM